MQKKNGILLVNLGTPEELTKTSIKQFLKVFLSDRRVIKTHPALWKPILHLFILPKRPQKSLPLYQEISHLPTLLDYTNSQKANLQTMLPDTYVEVGMSYSQPTIKHALEKLMAAEVERITVVPMYPQYSGTTVGSVFDEVMQYFYQTDQIIDLKFIASYYNNLLYIDYYAEKIKQILKKKEIDCLIFSYHGIPVSYVEDGDRYPDECTKTTQMIMERVGEVPYYQTYQSKFGPSEWLTPATDDMMTKLPKQGYKNILVVTPGFIVDCLETVHEMEIENKQYFLDAGGQEFTYLHPYNDDQQFADLIVDLVTNN